jgi:hypothetical protein
MAAGSWIHNLGIPLPLYFISILRRHDHVKIPGELPGIFVWSCKRLLRMRAIGYVIRRIWKFPQTTPLSGQ